MQRWIIVGAPIAALGMVLAAQACTSSENGAAPDGGVGAPDGSGGGDTGAGTETGAGADTGADTGTSADAGADVESPVQILATVPLPGVPQRLRYNEVTKKLYVMLSNAGPPGGIAVVDTTSDTVTGTMAATNDAGSPILFDLIAVDSSANVVYAAQYQSIYVFDGASNALTGTIDLSTVANSTLERVYGLAADGPGKKLYAIVGYVSGAQTVAVIDTSASLPTVTTTVALTDLVPSSLPHGDQLVVDTKNNLLFACALSRQSNGTYVPAADAIDTTTNTVKGAQQVFTGKALGCKAEPGFAAMFTANGTGIDGGPSAGEIELLEPAKMDLPFEPHAFVVDTKRYPGFASVAVFGTYGEGYPLGEFLFCGERLIGSSVQPGLPKVWGPMDLEKTNAVGHQHWYGTLEEVADGGDGGLTTLKYVYHLTIDSKYLPPTPDGGCPDGG